MPYACQFCTQEVPDGYTHVNAVFEGRPTCYEIDRETLNIYMSGGAERPMKEVTPISVLFADQQPPPQNAKEFSVLRRILGLLRPELRV